MKESKESKAGGSGSVASVDDGAIRDQQQRSIGVNQHVISIQKDGKILVQDLRNGYFPRQHMASSVIAISSQGHVAYQTGKIDRGDPLGLFVSTDRGGSADVQTVTKRLIEAPELFKEDQKLFGLPLTDRFLNMSESVSQSQPCTSAQEVLCDASKSTGGTGQAAICSSDNKDAERVDVSSDPPKSSATARTPLFFSRMQQRKPLYPDAKKEAVPTSPGRPKARRASAEYPSSASIENISTIHKSGLVYVGLAEIESFTAAHEICQV
jgi:hypothetical protein